MSYGEALLLTLVVELPLYVAGARALRLATTTRALLAALVANVATHPVLWWLLADGAGGVAGLVAAELAVCLVEAVLVRVVTRSALGPAALLALGANAASFSVGLVLSVAVG